MKCRYCKKEIEKETAYSPKKGIYYCNKNEYDFHEIEKNQKDKLPIDEHWIELVGILAELYGDSFNAPFILGQIKSLKKDYDMKTRGIIYSLYYYFDILGMKFDKTYGIKWIITKYYEESKKHYRELQKISKSVKDFEFDEDENMIIPKEKINCNKYINKIYDIKDDFEDL